MTWLLVLLLAALVLATCIVMFKVPRGGREAIAAALALGIAGYALQGRPMLSGAPHQYRETSMGDPAAYVEIRNALLANSGPPSSRWIVIADALVRRGSFADAAELLRGAVADNPRDEEAWLAMANALVGHADGFLTPAALEAYANASRTAPDSPGAPFFLGLAMAQSGRLAEARAIWAQLLAKAPADAPWRAEVEVRLVRLEAFMAGRVSPADMR